MSSCSALSSYRAISLCIDKNSMHHDAWSYTYESVRVDRFLSGTMPVEIQMLRHELDAEAQLHVVEVHSHERLLVALCWRRLRDHQFPVLDGDLLDVSGLKDHLVVDVDLVVDGDEAQLGHVAPLVGVVLHHDAHGPQPRHLLAVRVGNEHGVHVDLIVADEVEGESVLSLHGVAQGLSGSQGHCEMRIVTDPVAYAREVVRTR